MINIACLLAVRCLRTRVVGRNGDAIAEALAMFVGAIGKVSQANAGNREENEFRALGYFQRKNPPIFEGEHEPDKAQAWLKAVKKIFRVMNCIDVQKVRFDTHMLEKEAEDWWGNTAQRFDEEGMEVTWALFHDAYLENYFP
ncbi:uncharacterized protein LOC131613493 [Vicia villosa]|uniref:uncharacterized protein LOC131613493 n=1 Tax=Vicia villosa TaxID=3911 RepID=UPI00273B78A1|nr:uncharacterized protein LOC131613493 [Vicia villosa]